MVISSIHRKDTLLLLNNFNSHDDMLYQFFCANDVALFCAPNLCIKLIFLLTEILIVYIIPSLQSL